MTDQRDTPDPRSAASLARAVANGRVLSSRLDYWAGWQDGRRYGWGERGPGWWRRLMWRFGR